MAKGTATLRLNVPTVATAPMTEGGSCAPAGTKACNDSYGAIIPLTADWKEQKVSFAQLAQANYGVVASFDPKQLLGLLFQHTDTKANWDFWIDDVKFYKGGGGGGGADGGNVMVTPMPSPPVAGSCTNLKSVSNGSVTWYELNQGTKEFHCGNPIAGRNPDVAGYAYTGSGKYFGAINTADYANAAACGSCIEVTRDGSRKVTITVTDECPIATNPKCKAGHIDLSHEAFRQLGNDSEGYLGTGNGGMAGSISWKVVPARSRASPLGSGSKKAATRLGTRCWSKGTATRSPRSRSTSTTPGCPPLGKATIFGSRLKEIWGATSSERRTSMARPTRRSSRSKTATRWGPRNSPFANSSHIERARPGELSPLHVIRTRAQVPASVPRHPANTRLEVAANLIRCGQGPERRQCRGVMLIWSIDAGS